jgi:hypothetical protein
MVGEAMTTTSRLEIRTVVIGEQEYEKPYDPACPCCRSKWHLQIDELLSEGYTARAIVKFLAGRRPRPPQPEHIAAHVDHLAEPHRKLRLQLEESAEARGDEAESSSIVKLADVANAVVQRGFAAIAAGEMEINSRDLLRALTIAAQLEKSGQGSGTSTDAWQSVFVEMLGLVRQHMSPAQWQAFAMDVHASPAIRAALTESQPAIPPAGVPS